MRRKNFSPNLDGLEDRRLLAGSIGFNPDGGALAFYAGEGASQAELSYAPGDPSTLVATIDGVTRTFSAAEVSIVYFNGVKDGDGGNSFVNNTNEISVSFLIGPGNSVVGGTGADYVIDYSNSADIDDQGGGIGYFESEGVNRTVSISQTRSGSTMIRVS